MYSNKMVRKAVFPAAGLGTRFLPATKASPKEMLPLVDKPMIQYVVEEAVDSGMEHIIMITGRGKRAIEDHFDRNVELEFYLEAKGKTSALRDIEEISNMVNFVYVRQKEPLGLGHAVLCAKDIVGNEPFAILLGDDIIASEVPALKQMLQIFDRYHYSVLALQEVPKDQIHLYGVIQGESLGEGIYKVQRMVEKPRKEDAPSNLAIIGRYILTPRIFGFLEKQEKGVGGEIQLTNALQRLAEVEPVYGYILHGKRYDAGSKIGFLEATVEFGLKNSELGPAFKSYLKGLDLDAF
ncbi:MAG: UTP--glucose-1-phosphate uridylyltransferase GalU [bacterium]